MSNRNTYLAGLLLPLAFAIPAKAQEFNLQKINAKNIESFFGDIKIPEVKGEPSYVIIDQGQNKGTYNLPMVCPNSTRDAGRFMADYKNFSKRWGLAYFSVITVPQNGQPFDSGTFSIRTSTNTSHPNVNQLNKYDFITTNNERAKMWSYSIKMNKHEFDDCVDLTVSYEEKKFNQKEFEQRINEK